MTREIVFLNINEPSDALQLAKKPEFRAHVARYQRRQAVIKRSTDRIRKNKAAPASADAKTQTETDAPCQDVVEASTSTSVVLPSSVIPPTIGGLRVDPFQSYPMAFRSWMPLLVDHYLMHMAVDIPELDQPGNRGLLRTSWFPLVMTDSALFAVIMLIAASHYAAAQGASETMKLNLLALRCEAVQSVNRSLEAQDSKIVGDALLGAIAKMASYEAMFGSRENYTIHMQGLVRAIHLRGGFTSLGLNGLLRRIVIWIDRNSAFLHGLALYFPGYTFSQGERLLDPNPGQFLGSS